MNKLLFIPIALGALIFLRMTYGAYRSKDLDTSVGVFFGALLGGAAFFLSGAIMGAIMGNNHSETTGYIRLVALSNSTQLSGEFFLGTGSIESGPAYTYLSGNEERGYALRQLDAHITRVFTVKEGDTPHIDVRKGVCSPDDWWPKQCWGMKTYNVYIPANSIWQGYDLDVRKG